MRLPLSNDIHADVYIHHLTISKPSPQNILRPESTIYFLLDLLEVAHQQFFFFVRWGLGDYFYLVSHDCCRNLPQNFSYG